MVLHPLWTLKLVITGQVRDDGHFKPLLKLSSSDARCKQLSARMNGIKHRDGSALILNEMPNHLSPRHLSTGQI